MSIILCLLEGQAGWSRKGPQGSFWVVCQGPLQGSVGFYPSSAQTKFSMGLGASSPQEGGMLYTHTPYTTDPHGIQVLSILRSAASPKHLASNSDRQYPLPLKLKSLPLKFSSKKGEPEEGRAPLLECSPMCSASWPGTSLQNEERSGNYVCLILLILDFQSDEPCSVTPMAWHSKKPLLPPGHSNSMQMVPSRLWSLQSFCCECSELSFQLVLQTQIKVTDILLWNLECNAHNFGTCHINSSYFELNMCCVSAPTFFSLNPHNNPMRLVLVFYCYSNRKSQKL